MSTYQIAVLPGDGIGPEVTDEGLKVLRAVEQLLAGVSFETTEYSVGAGEYLKSGDALPDNTFAAIERADAILLGAMGLPNVRWPDGNEMTPQIDIRERLDLYCGYRPLKLYHPGDSPLREPGSIDFAIIRENTEGLFSSRLQKFAPNATEARDTMLVTRDKSLKLFHSAFKIARKRNRRLALIDKANVLPSMSFFRKVFDEVATAYPDVATERIYVDAASLFMLQRPQSFDVMVTENMFGDILSDLGAGLIGGMGMAPSADIGDDHAVFQPSHGTAPDIAGKGIANPIAMILSIGLMLEWLPDAESKRGAAMIESAVAKVLQDRSVRTTDLGGSVSTTAMGDLVAAALA